MPDSDPRDTCGPVRADALAVFPGGDGTLVAEGWVRRFMADPGRATEATALYESLGYEVRSENLTPAEFDERCGECPEDVCRAYVLLYTRKP